MNAAISHAWPQRWFGAEFSEILQRTRARYPISDQVHFAAAILYMFTLPLAPAPASIGIATLTLISTVRIYQTWRCYLYLVKDWVLWLFIAWSAWQLASFLWSDDWRQGWQELKVFRILITPWMLLPMLDRLTWLIAACLSGIATQNLAQIGQWIGIVERKQWDYEVGLVAGQRYRGLTHPIITGALCALALGWHSAAMLRGATAVRVLSIIGFVLAGLGLILSGSRGPWISAVVSLPLGAMLIASKWREARKPIAAILILTAFAAIIAWFAGGDFIEKRIDRALHDIEQAETGEYRTDVGFRIVSYRAAWDVFMQHPIIGTGIGEFRKAVINVPNGELLKNSNHAHCGYLHVLATTGILGGVLFGAMIILTLMRFIAIPPPGIYGFGFCAALLSWLVGNVFDVYHLNGMMLGALAFMMLASSPVLKRYTAAS